MWWYHSLICHMWCVSFRSDVLRLANIHKNTHNTQINLNKQKLSEPYVYLKPVEQTMYSATGWRRLVGSPKLQIIFHKRATEYRSLLRKMTYKDKGSYESSHPVQGCIWRKTCRQYSQLQRAWHRISRWFLKLFQRTRFLPMGCAISTT